jgi:hypothetical protein
MADVEEVEVVVAHNERVTPRVGDVFLKMTLIRRAPRSRSTGHRTLIPFRRS